MKNIAHTFLALALCLVVPGMHGIAWAQEPVLVERNLFSPDRTPPALEDSAANSGEGGLSLSPESLQLDAVLIFGDVKKALLSFPNQDEPQIAPANNRRNNAPRQRRRPRRGAAAQRSSKWVTEQDSVADFTIKSILAEEVQLLRDGEDFVILLHQADKISQPDSALPTAPAVGAATARKKQPGEKSLPAKAVKPPANTKLQPPSRPSDSRQNIPNPNIPAQLRTQ
jgi:hypothetical protein